MTRERALEALRSIAILAVKAQTADFEPPADDLEVTELEDLVADIEGDLITINAYLAEVRA